MKEFHLLACMSCYCTMMVFSPFKPEISYYYHPRAISDPMYPLTPTHAQLHPLHIPLCTPHVPSVPLCSILLLCALHAPLHQLSLLSDPCMSPLHFCTTAFMPNCTTVDALSVSLHAPPHPSVPPLHLCTTTNQIIGI